MLYYCQLINKLIVKNNKITNDDEQNLCKRRREKKMDAD